MAEGQLVSILSELGIELSGGILVLIPIIPAIVARLKEFPILKSLQDKGYPAFETTAIVLGILTALGLSVPNPIVVGIVLGLAGIGGRQTVKRKEVKNVDSRTITTN